MSARPLRRLPAVPALLALVIGAAVLPAVAATSARAATPGAVAATANVPTVAAPTVATPKPAAFVKLPGFVLDRSAKVTVAPTRYAGFSVDLAAVRASLAQAPTRAEVADGAKPILFSIPAPDGSLARFEVAEDSVMQAGLQAAHPEIRSYAGTALAGQARSIRFDVSPLGFHASVRSPGGGRSWYVDPAYVGRGVEQHVAYYGAAVPAPAQALKESGLLHAQRVAAAAPPTPNVSTTPGGVVTQRVYRMAFITDPTYAAYFGTANVLAAKVALINRTNQIYNDDLAIKFVLIDQTDKLNLDTVAKASGPNGPCGANACYSKDVYTSDGTTTGTPPVPDAPDGCDGALLTRNEFVLGQIVGADSFDVGHIGLGVNGGGIAGLGVVGGASKADGCTGLPLPTGDFYAVDYFSHEVGHEMGANHPFNGTQVNCSLTNRNGGTSVEPGSGTSVMAYAGICGSDNLQPHSDPYMSQRSIDEITDNTSATPGSENEVQTVSLAGFDADGDTFKLGFGTAAPIVITRGTTYRALLVQQQIAGLTGCQVVLGNYDASNNPQISDNGFTVRFNNPLDCAGTDEPRLTVSGGTGGVTGFVGVQVNGGADTNIGMKQLVTTDHAPVVTAPADKDLPIRTPFTLNGSATDSDGDKLIYLWEQNDTGSVSPTGGTGLVDNTKIDGPLFRVFGTYANVTSAGTLLTPSPGENVANADGRSRTFPDMAQVLADNTNAETGTCPDAGTTLPVPVPIVNCFSEFLPTADYGAPVAGLPSLGGTLDFRLTARDLFPTGGGTGFDDVALTVDNTAGPFQVTSRAVAGTPAAAGSPETVTWDVNGTDAATLAPNVKITLSVDGGDTFPYVLADTTPNDGSQSVLLPQVSTARARIKIEAINNYFFDTNDADFKINGPLTVAASGNGHAQYSDVLSGATVTASSSTVDADQLKATVTGVDGIALGTPTLSAANVRPSTATFPVVGAVTEAPGTYTATVKVTEGTASGAATKTATFDVTVTPEDAAATYSGARTFKASEATAPVTLAATVTDDADGSRGLINRARVSFVNRASNKVLCTSAVAGGPTTGTATCTTDLPATTGAGTSYTIGTVVDGNYTRNSSADDAVIKVVRTAADVVAPDTLITTGLANNSFARAAQVVFGLKGTETPVTFTCNLDNKVVSCGKNLRTPVLTTGVTHVLRVAARDLSGNLDKTPAVRQFASPYTVAQLTQATGSWTRGRDAASYRGTYLATKFSGQSLTRRGSGITKISLVYTQMPRAGRIGVYLGTKLLRVVPTNGPKTKKRVLVLSKSFGSKMAGTVRLVTMDDKPVRVEGLGLLQPKI